MPITDFEPAALWSLAWLSNQVNHAAFVLQLGLRQV